MVHHRLAASCSPVAEGGPAAAEGVTDEALGQRFLVGDPRLGAGWGVWVDPEDVGP